MTVMPMIFIPGTLQIRNVLNFGKLSNLRQPIPTGFYIYSVIQIVLIIHKIIGKSCQPW